MWQSGDKLEIKSGRSRGRVEAVPTKIYSFGLTTFEAVRSSPLPHKKKKKVQPKSSRRRLLLWLANLLGAVKHALQIGTPWRFTGSVVQERAPLETETKGGQKGINPARGGGRRAKGVEPKFLLGYLRASSLRYLAAIKTTRAWLWNESWAWNLFVLLNLFMSLFDCTETIPGPGPGLAENHSSANGNGRPLKLGPASAKSLAWALSLDQVRQEISD